MVFNHSMQPRQRLLCLLALFLFQEDVTGWTFSKQKVHLILPEDYPLNTPFYRVSVVPSNRDVAMNTIIDYSMKLIPFRKGASESSAVKRELFVELDKKTGILKLVKKPPSNMNRGRRRHRMFANITLTGFSKNDKISRKSEILIEFSGILKNYCSPKMSTCFSAKKYNYRLPEDSTGNATIDYLMNPGLPSVCPNMSFQYNLEIDQDFITVGNLTGILHLVAEVDAEEHPVASFTVTCTVRNEIFSTAATISVDDINDNAPFTQSGNTSEQMVYRLKPDQKHLNFAVTAIDKDSKDVNKMKVKIENDVFNLFQAQPLRVYGSIENQKNTFLYAEIHSKDLLQRKFTDYNFSVVIQDTTTRHKDNKVVFEIFLVRENYNFELQDVFEVNISRDATEFARVLQVAKIPDDSIEFSNWRFKLSGWRKNRDWLNITNKSGIVYVRNPLLITNKSVEQRKILWWKKNGTHEISGTSVLIINIIKGLSEPCVVDNWCSFYGSRAECVKNCGKGSAAGQCMWRQEPLIISSPNSLFSACSPDFTTCPDGQCDELERMEPSLCPLDCAKEAFGTAIQAPSIKGITKAMGVCTCKTVDSCYCSLPPAELRFVYDDETSTPVEAIPAPGFLLEGSCGLGCVVLVSVVPCVVVILIIAIFIVRRHKSNPVSHLKLAGSRISLSAVPSDYIQDRPSSVQDTRAITGESSGTGKKILDPKWEFPRSRLQFQTVLGEGEFGKVVKAQALNIGGTKGLTVVAVKMLKDNGGTEEMQDLISEFTLLKDISHPNVIKLLGASTEKGGPFYLIVEYAEMGSLRSYLRKKRKHNNCCKYNPTYGIPDINSQLPREYYQFMCERSRYEPRHCYFHKEQLSYAWQISKGMAYLADMKLVHRDLAARNVLLNKRKVAKISDFGLSRDVYKGEAYLKKTKGRVPVKWLAIESLEDQIYTSKSDVWSFGVVLWEIMMQGATPYPGVTPQRLFNLLKAGYRMSKPDYCPDELYVIIRQCWKRAPNERPPFKQLVQDLDNLLQDTVEYMDFDYRNARLNHRSMDLPLLSPIEPSTSNLQYTSVVMENDEEYSVMDSTENIGLVNLFNEPEKDSSQTTYDRV